MTDTTGFTKTKPSRAAEIAHSNHDPNLSVRVNLSGPLNRYTGYGNHTVELALAMLRHGADVRIWPENCNPPLPAEILATMLEPWDFQPPVGVVIANPSALARTAEHTIGISTWETTKLPPDSREPLSSVDEILVTCPANIATFQEFAPNTPIRWVPEGVDSNFFTPRPRDWASTPLKIGMMGALTTRKGVDLAIDAFLDLYEGNPDVELHIASSDWGLPHFELLPKHHANIFSQRLGRWTREQIRDWYYGVHALFSPFRGEGWYMPGCEMMSTGGILIAPRAQGTECYHQSSTGWVIPHKFVPVTGFGTLSGVEATEAYGEWVGYDHDAIKDTLRSFVESSASEKRTRADRAASQIGHYANWDYAGQQVIDSVLAGLSK